MSITKEAYIVAEEDMTKGLCTEGKKIKSIENGLEDMLAKNPPYCEDTQDVFDDLTKLSKLSKEAFKAHCIKCPKCEDAVNKMHTYLADLAWG